MRPRPRDEPRGWGALQPPPGYYTADGRPPDAAQRGLILDWAVNQRIASGWRVESRSETQVVMVRGRPVSHVLHAVLTVFTCFLWGAVWLVLTVTNKIERVALTVDAQGRIISVNGPG
ncbi:hypothetical protein AB0L71_21830 [Streptomyces sp. NPDC052052]|uniref:hypothetical protein n=1 Tax=Streptomyces sp. NPDC052052 TaxID=3154756 RepID=UPI0034185E0E